MPGKVVEQLVRPTGLIDPELWRCGRPRTRSTTSFRKSVIRVREERAGADHHADQAHGRAADRLPGRQRRQGALPAQRYRHGGAGGDPARPAAGQPSTCWSGINLLREGLDIPEVSLVAILDADKEGFLRSERSLIQTIGRAARNLNGTGDPVRRPHDRFDEEGASARRTGAAPSRSRYNEAARHHAAQHQEAGARPDRRRLLRKGQRRSMEKQELQRAMTQDMSEKDVAQGNQAAGKTDAGARPQPRIREGGPGPGPAGHSSRNRLSGPSSTTT